MNGIEVGMTEHRPHQRAESTPSWRHVEESGDFGFYKRHSSYNSSSDLPFQFCGRGSKSSEKLTRQDYEGMEATLLKHFNKKYFFRPPAKDWSLPDPTEMFVADKWQDDQLQKLKKELNRVKSKLDLFSLNEWHKHTRQMNKAGDIQWRLRKEIEPEFLTQAWCKFYENAKSFPLVPPIVRDTGVLNTVHLCEAPGAFITSLNHYLKLHYPDVKWSWQATTLNPYYEGNPLSCMINDDRFILQTLEHWKFGRDYTGNLMDVDNMLDLVEDAHKMGEVLLVTADGSIDCQEDPGEQECKVSSLNHCETVAALHILAPGGSFLLKMFTMYEYETVCLIYLLWCSFKSVRVFKPATSREGNSEVYVVCLEYKGREYMEPWLEVLRRHHGPCLPVNAMFPKSSIPSDFLDQLYECTLKFKNYQTDVIETNIRTYELHRLNGNPYIVKKIRSLTSSHFMRTYDMRKIDESDEVVGKSKLGMTMTLNFDPRSETGSFDDRRRQQTMEPLELLMVLRDEVTNMRLEWTFKDDVKWVEFPECVDGFKITTGKPVETVHSSKFCLGKILKIRNQVWKIAKEEMRSRSSSELSCESSSSLDTGKGDGSVFNIEHIVSQLLKEERPKTRLIVKNCKKELWTSMESGNMEAERKAFRELKKIIDGLWRDDNLLLQGYPMLTQFNVGIVYMICHLFEEVGFVKPCKQDFGVIFIGFRKWNPEMECFLAEVDATLKKLKEDGGEKTVISLFPVNKLCDNFNVRVVARPTLKLSYIPENNGREAEVHSEEEEEDNETNEGETERPESHKDAGVTDHILQPIKRRKKGAESYYSSEERSELLKTEENDSGDFEVGCENLFYKYVTMVNHLCVKEQVLDVIDNIIPQ